MNLRQSRAILVPQMMPASATGEGKSGNAVMAYSRARPPRFQGAGVFASTLLTLAIDGSGTIRVQNDAPGTVQLILDLNGYFE